MAVAQAHQVVLNGHDLCVPGPLLKVDDLRVAYGRTTVLHGVCLSVPAGGILAVVGPNRAGKTTLLRAVSGLLALHRGQVTGGHIDLAGERLAGDAAARVRAGVAHVLEGRRVFADLTVEENLRAGAFTIGARSGARVAWVLERFPALAARRGLRAGLLSGGEQQLLAMARALVPSPRLLLLDEPTLGLAHQSVQLVAHVVQELACDGTSVLVAEQRAVLALGGHVATLERGRVVARAPA